MILTVANLKGGVGKTTTAAYLAHALRERGRNVLVLDADPQGSMVKWAEYGAWGLPVERWQPGRAPGVVEHDWAVVVDTPPTDSSRGAVEAAVRESTHLVVPIAPSAIEYGRSAVMRSLVDDTARPGLEASVVQVRTVAGAASTALYRDMLTADGWHVLRASVRRREAFAQAYGEPITRAGTTDYGTVLAELLGDPS